MIAVDLDPRAVSGPEASLDEERRFFADAFVDHAPRLFRYLSRQVSRPEAEDLLAETFCAAWQQRDQFRPERGPLVGWLFGIATNLLRRHKRSWLRGAAAVSRLTPDARAVGDDTERVVDRVDAASAARVLAAGLLALNDRDREVLLLSSWGQLDHAEISAALDIPVGTVRSRLHRARRQMRACLAPATEGENDA